MRKNKSFIMGIMVGLLIWTGPYFYLRMHVVDYAAKDIVSNDAKKGKLMEAINPDFLKTLTGGSK